MSKYQQHELSAAFPGMTTSELAALTADIAEEGQREPITLFQGKILDGFHRYCACNNCGRVPKFVELPAGVDPVAFVKSRNLHRRHLSGSQRAAAVVACNEWARPGANQHTGASAPGAAPATVKAMAKEAEVSPRTIQHAKAAHVSGKGGAVRDGEISAKDAAESVKPKNVQNVPNNGGQGRSGASVCAGGKTPAPANPAKLDAVSDSRDAVIDALETENARLTAENEMMAKVIDADDQLKANHLLTAENAMLKTRIDSLMTEKNELAKLLRREKSLKEKLQREISKTPLPVTIEVERVPVDDGGLPE